MKKHSARVAPLSACSTPVLSLTRADGEGAAARAGTFYRVKVHGHRFQFRCVHCSISRSLVRMFVVVTVLSRCGSEQQLSLIIVDHSQRIAQHPTMSGQELLFGERAIFTWLRKRGVGIWIRLGVTNREEL